jgi:hypothetical protein
MNEKNSEIYIESCGIVNLFKNLIQWENSEINILFTEKKLSEDITSLFSIQENGSCSYFIFDEHISKHDCRLINFNPIFLCDKFPSLNNYSIYKFMNFFLGIPLSKNDSFQKEFDYKLKMGSEITELILDCLIHCVMIVKNSGDKFEKILENNGEFIDDWTILDTGSTDNTPEIVSKFLENRKGKLYKEPFINFRDSRNRAFDLAGKSCVYNLVLDDSYIIKNGDKLRRYLNIFKNNKEITSISIKVISESNSYDSCRITKSDSYLRYMYRVHESIKDDKPSIVLPMDAYVFDESSEYMEERTKSRMESDLKLLKEDYYEDIKNPRYLFYIAQSYTGLEKYEKAYKWYTKRIKTKYKGFDEEIYCSYYRRALLAELKMKLKWSKCHKLYLQAFKNRPHRAEPLITIADHYLREENYELALMYAMYAREKSFPFHDGLFVEKRFYDIDIPMILMKICIRFRKYELGLECSQDILKTVLEETSTKTKTSTKTSIYHNINTSEIEEYFRIYSMKVSVNNLNPKKEYSLVNESGKKVLCIVTDGNFFPWNGETCDSRGLGGSETSAVKFGEELSRRGYTVIIFCNCVSLKDCINLEKVVNGVHYFDIKKYLDFVANFYIDICIILRYSIYLPVSYAPNVGKVYLWLQDVLPQSNILMLENSFAGALCLSDWHKEIFSQSFPICPKEKIYVTSNAICLEKFNSETEIAKNSFIYSSFPDRGLYYLLKLFPRIKTAYPDATLNVFCNTKLEIFKFIREIMDEIELMLEQPGVKNHGWVSQVKLCEYWDKSDIWFYPCIFPETSCITSLEAAASRTVAVCNDLAALGEMVGERGIIIPGNPSTFDWQEEALKKLFFVMDNREVMEKLRNQNREWAQNMTYSKVVDRWLEYLL